MRSLLYSWTPARSTAVASESTRVATAGGRVLASWLRAFTAVGSFFMHSSADFSPRPPPQPLTPLATSAILSSTTSIFACPGAPATRSWIGAKRSEEHTSELQSRLHLVCRLLLEKKKTISETLTTTVQAT